MEKHTQRLHIRHPVCASVWLENPKTIVPVKLSLKRFSNSYHATFYLRKLYDESITSITKRTKTLYNPPHIYWLSTLLIRGMDISSCFSHNLSWDSLKSVLPSTRRSEWQKSRSRLLSGLAFWFIILIKFISEQTLFYKWACMPACVKSSCCVWEKLLER